MKRDLRQRHDGRRAFDFGEMIEEFGRIRARLVELTGEQGREEYYRVLGAFGCKHANEFKSAAVARQAYRRLLAAARRAQTPDSLAGPPQLGLAFDTAGEQAPAEEQPRCKRRKRRGRTITERFKEFDAENPQVYVEFVRVTREVRTLGGGRRFGHRFIWERMRWELHFERSDGEKYKLNDAYIRDYAEKAMEQEPDLKGIFKLRAKRRRERTDG